MTKSKEYLLNLNIDSVIDSFLDLVCFGELHPLITQVKKIDSENSSSTYKIYEKPFSWLPFRIQYYAIVDLIDKSLVRYSIKGIPFVKGIIDYSFNQLSTQQTKVLLNINLQSKVFGKHILMRKMMDAQDVIMAKMENPN